MVERARRLSGDQSHERRERIALTREI